MQKREKPEQRKRGGQNAAAPPVAVARTRQEMVGEKEFWQRAEDLEKWRPPTATGLRRILTEAKGFTSPQAHRFTITRSSHSFFFLVAVKKLAFLPSLRSSGGRKRTRVVSLEVDCAVSKRFERLLA